MNALVVLLAVVGILLATGIPLYVLEVGEWPWVLIRRKRTEQIERDYEEVVRMISE